MLKKFMKKYIPAWTWHFYHYTLARLATVFYRYPSERLVVIGVTGTNGKSSTCQLIGQLLEALGNRVGWTTTAGFKIAEEEWVNNQKMTMLGRLQTQKNLRRMIQKKCTHAIIETSSQGLLQSRHVGINYDVAVFTNLTPEHIEAHGGFDAYKEAKRLLFFATAKGKQKRIDGKRIPKTFVANINDPYAPYYLESTQQRIRLFGFGIEGKESFLPKGKELVVENASDVVYTSENIRFALQGYTGTFPLIGPFNTYNILGAMTTLRSLGYSWEAIFDATKHLRPIEGRMEPISEGQPFTVIVDYAYEPYALRAVYDALSFFSYERLIHIIGSCGGGRDISRRAILGQMAAQEDDIVIVTNEDPYDEDPEQIIDDVAQGALKAGKVEGKNLFRILDRRQAIERAIALAGPKDLVLITAKGNEPVMAVAGGKKIPWDDRLVVRESLKKMIHSFQ